MDFNHYIIDCQHTVISRKNVDGYLHFLKINEYKKGHCVSIHHMDVFDKSLKDDLNSTIPFECKKDLVPELVMRMYFPYGTLQDYYIELI